MRGIHYMRKIFLMAMLSIFTFILSSCSVSSNTQFAEMSQNYFRLQPRGSAELERAFGLDDYEQIELAQRLMLLFDVLEDEMGAFICDTWNYQVIDGKPRYEYNLYEEYAPVQIDSYGQSIRVSEGYFIHNPIETSDGSNLLDGVIHMDDTMNILVPEQYRNLEEGIIRAFRERFYFDKILVENIYNERQGEPLNTTEESELNINIIYVKDGQSYFAYNRDIATKSSNLITDPTVIIYTPNFHPIQIHAMMTRGIFVFDEDRDIESLYKSILFYAQNIDADAETALEGILPLSDYGSAPLYQN